MPRSTPVPSYRLHKPSGQAVITIRTQSGARRDVYLGVHNTPESRAEYGRLISELAAGAPAGQVAGRPDVPTVDQVLLAFWRHAERHYRRPDGTTTQEVSEYKQAFRVLQKLYGHTPARDFGRMALKAVRAGMVGKGWRRTLVNRRVGRIRRAFKWCASEQLVLSFPRFGGVRVSGVNSERGVYRCPVPDRRTRPSSSSRR